MEIEPVTIMSFCLAHFRPMLHFYTPQKRQKTKDSSTLAGGIEKGNWPKMGQYLFKTEPLYLAQWIRPLNQKYKLRLS